MKNKGIFASLKKLFGTTEQTNGLKFDLQKTGKYTVSGYDTASPPVADTYLTASPPIGIALTFVQHPHPPFFSYYTAL